jgi:hypothetical protein
MPKQQVLYSKKWQSKIKSEDLSSSWAGPVFDNYDEDGSVYLSTVREWFSKFPFVTTGQTKHMKKSLEGLNTEDHLGAVNELFWYNLAIFLGWQLKPLVVDSAAPDFEVSSPACFYCEVTTLNVSQSDRKRLENGFSAPLNHSREAIRILRKATDEKIEQLKYGHNDRKPSILVVFDYSTFSGLGTQRPQYLADALLHSSSGLQGMPKELSVLLYLERYILKGRFRLRLSQSAAYHNPLADFSLEKEVFSWVTQFVLSEYREIPPQSNTDLLIV